MLLLTGFELIYNCTSTNRGENAYTRLGQAIRAQTGRFTGLISYNDAKIRTHEQLIEILKIAKV